MTYLPIAVAVLVSLSHAQPQDLIVFGDSLSDSGIRNVGGGAAAWTKFVYRTDQVFPELPYANGRFCNGPVWVEYAADSLGISFVNWAAGGASTGPTPGTVTLPAGFAGLPEKFNSSVPTLSMQVDQHYLTTNSTADPAGVYLIFIGVNDYFSVTRGYNPTAELVVGAIQDAMESLYSHGARRFIVATMPPFTVLPEFLATYPEVVALFQRHNQLISEFPASFQSNHSGSNIRIFDYSAVVAQIAENFQALGLTNSTACYSPENLGQGPSSGAVPCTDPSSHFQWDLIHPSTAGHAEIGKAFAEEFAPLWKKTLPPSQPLPAPVG